MTEKLTIEEYGLLRELLGRVIEQDNSDFYKSQLETGLLRSIALKLKGFVEE